MRREIVSPAVEDRKNGFLRVPNEPGLGVPLRPGKSSPVLTSEHVFVTAFENQALYTQCFDRSTGKLSA
jgi:hypothetical protein